MQRDADATPLSRRHNRSTMGLALLGTLLLLTSPAAAGGATAVDSAPSVDLADRGWVWPAASFSVEAPYAAPEHDYAPGHRGIDLRLRGELALVAPAGGVVAFSGDVAGRGILTIDHGDGLVTTLEPVESPLSPGSPVERGETVAVLALGGHSEPGTVHFGVRWRGEYINPLLLLGGIRRAILLPCC